MYLPGSPIEPSPNPNPGSRALPAKTNRGCVGSSEPLSSLKPRHHLTPSPPLQPHHSQPQRSNACNTSNRPSWPSTPSIPRCKSTAASSQPPETNAISPRDLLRRLNPKQTTSHLNTIISLAPDLTEDLLASVDQPLTVKRCKDSGREYLLCDYNRDGDSYRSPWSNKFDPPVDGGAGGVAAGGNEGAGEGAIPSERVRKMEIKANEAFDVYRELYYEGGVSSVYFWNLDDGFAGVVLLKKCKFLFHPVKYEHAG